MNAMRRVSACLELRQVLHGQADGLAEAEFAVLGVLPLDDQLRAEAQVVADKRPGPGTEAERERHVGAVAEADGQGDAGHQLVPQIERAEEAVPVLGQAELLLLDDEAGLVEHPGDEIEHERVLDRHPGFGARRRLDERERLSGDGFRSAVEHDVPMPRCLLPCGEGNDHGKSRMWLSREAG